MITIKQIISLFAACLIFTLLNAQQVDRWLVMGPLPVEDPAFLNGKNVRGEAFSTRFVLSNQYMDLAGFHPEAGDPLLWDDYRPRTWSPEEVAADGFLIIKREKHELQIAYSGFYIESDGLFDYTCRIESPQMFEVFLEGKKVTSCYDQADKDTTNIKSASLKLDRGKFMVLIKSIYEKGDKNKWRIKADICSHEDSLATLDISPLTRMNIHHLLEGTRLGDVSLSADGSMMSVDYSRVNTETGKNIKWTEIKKTETGKLVQSFRKGSTSGYHWMPSGKKLYYKEKTENGTSVVVYDFETGTEYKTLRNIKDPGFIRWADNEQFIVYGIEAKKPTGEKSSLRYMDELHNRTFRPYSVTALYRYNVNTGISTRLSFGERSANFHDLSPDGNRILFATNRPNPTQRPFGLQNMYLMDLETGRTDTLWKDFRWSGAAQFSPDGKQLLVTGGPDLFGGIGRNIGDQPLANNYDLQLYIYAIETGEINPITRDFDPKIEEAVWHPVDNRIYAKATQEVYVRLFFWDAESNEFSMIPTVPGVMDELSIARKSLTAAYTGTSLGSPNKAWVLNLEDSENRLIDHSEDVIYEHVSFGESEDWDFVAADGTTIRGYFLYPREFDPGKKYPLIVNYYGGTNPIEKSFGGRYPLDVWAGEDYVVYVPQPSGATGFGQEFSARHQNNWGIVTIDEIIEGTKKFIAAHDFVDSSRVGCIGASYGGFTTMLLMSKTDLFTCGISHAGISSISSYWGEGYWGFGYSSEATGDSYPWNRRDIYIDQSALFNADRINTPLLLLHGAEDTNVPIGESLQLWVGLKILGKPVEMVQVEGEDHWILTYSKRIEWHNTIMAWFDKWLNDSPHDWKKLFPQSEL